MLREETESFTSRQIRSDDIGMKNLTYWSNKVSKTITVIERPMIRGPKRLVVQPFGRKLVAEWQQRGPETLSGHAVRKLRLAFAPPHVTTASAAGKKGQP
jgi:hypothetical protein